MNSQVRATFGMAMPARLNAAAMFSKTCIACWSRGAETSVGRMSPSTQ